jgi:hypothetical protein
VIRHILKLSFFWLLLAATIVYGQEDPLARWGLHRNPDLDQPAINQHLEGQVGGFDVAIDFEELPEPLKPVRATLTLTVRTSKPESVDYPWQIDFRFPKNKIRWLSEPSLVFPGPYTAGDVYRVTIEFICLASGTYNVELWSHDYSTAPFLMADMAIGIGLTRDGRLVGLRRTRGGSDAGGLATVFFTADSVSIVSGRAGDFRSEMFDGDCIVVPAFRIGEPSKVCFNLRFLRDFPNGLDLEFSYGHMEISELPPAVKGPVYAGDEMQFCVTAVPLAVREVHDLALTVYPGDHQSGKDVWSLGAVFKDDGTLRYIDEGLILDDLIAGANEAILPKAFPPGTRATCGSRWVLRSE